VPRVFILSPAQCGGERARLLARDGATFALAQRLAAGAASLGEVMAFLSGLYFRGKRAYASAFANPPARCEGAWVITPAAGLVPLEAPVSRAHLAAFGEVPIRLDEPRYVDPLLVTSLDLARRLGRTEVVLLGSLATPKYTAPLVEVFGHRLRFPACFIGRGDMSRGSVMLKAARAGVELEYARVAGPNGRS
jgi:hypothetical protein